MGFDILSWCRPVLKGNLHQLCILAQGLVRMLCKIKRIWFTTAAKSSILTFWKCAAYVVNKKCSHLLARGSCRCIFLCGSLPHSEHLGHRKVRHKVWHTPGLESHISHHKSSHRVIDSQLLCRKRRGCPASQRGKHKCPCVSRPCTLPCCHIWWVDRGQHIRLTCKFCQMDSHHLFGIVLAKKEEENECLSQGGKCTVQ